MYSTVKVGFFPVLKQPLTDLWGHPGDLAYNFTGD